MKYQNYKYFWVQTSRGCPHDCEFCTVARMNGKIIRHKTSKQVVAEIKWIKERFGNIDICFSDENFFVNKNAAKAIINNLAKLKIRWHAMSDISLADDVELIKQAKNSGCDFILLGLESVENTNLKQINKNHWKYKKFAKYESDIAKIQENGIRVMGSFIFGLDEDDAKIFDDTIKFIFKNHLYPIVNVLTPYPGTRLRTRLEQEHRILDTGWDNYTIYGINFVPKKMTVGQLANGLVRLLKKVYSNELKLKLFMHFKRLHKNFINLN